MNNLEPKGNERPCVALITICERVSFFSIFLSFRLEKHFFSTLFFSNDLALLLDLTILMTSDNDQSTANLTFFRICVLLLLQKVEPNIWSCASTKNLGPKWLKCTGKSSISSILKYSGRAVIIFYCKFRESTYVHVLKVKIRDIGYHFAGWLILPCLIIFMLPKPMMTLSWDFFGQIEKLPKNLIHCW